MGADLKTQTLHIAQAIELSGGTLGDPASRDADRALTICWLAHLMADAHQPCHAGSLYFEKVFTEMDDDRGANRVPTRQKGNLHALWDQLLGPDFSLQSTRRRKFEIESDVELVTRCERAIARRGGSDPRVWLEESRHAAVEHVYTPEILDSFHMVHRGIAEAPGTLDLSEAYLRNVGRGDSAYFALTKVSYPLF